MNPEERFEETFRRTYPRVYAYCVRRANADATPDLVSEVYATAWRRRRRLPEGEAALLWLLAVARRQLANHTRSQRRRARLTARLNAKRDPEAAPQVDAAGDTELGRALESLPETDRELLRLAYWDDLAPREIAALNGLTENAVAVRLSRARRRLRHLLAEPSRQELEEGVLS